MPNELALTLGQTTVRVPIKLTALQARAVLRALLRIVRDGSLDQQRMEALAAQQAALEATLAADNELFDEPAPP
jgi:hypothetical protein